MDISGNYTTGDVLGLLGDEASPLRSAAEEALSIFCQLAEGANNDAEAKQTFEEIAQRLRDALNTNAADEPVDIVLPSLDNGDATVAVVWRDSTSGRLRYAYEHPTWHAEGDLELAAKKVISMADYMVMPDDIMGRRRPRVQLMRPEAAGQEDVGFPAGEIVSARTGELLYPNGKPLPSSEPES